MILTFEATIRGGLPVEVDADIWTIEGTIHSALLDVRFPRKRGKQGSSMLTTYKEDAILEEEAIDAYLAGKD